MKDIKNIIITGAHLSTNYGSQAMALETINLLKRLFPQSRITFYTIYYEVDRLLNEELQIDFLYQGKIQHFLKNLGNVMFWSKLMKNVPENNPYVKSYHNASIIVDISGDMLTGDLGLKHTIRTFKEFLTPIVLKKPFIILPQSIGPFKTNLTKSIAKFILNRAKLIIAREEITLSHLKNLGIKTRIELFPDMAFFLKPSEDKSIIETFRKQNDLDNNKMRLIGISLSQSIQKYAETSRNYKSSKSGYVDVFAYVCDHLIAKLNATVVLVPHVSGPKDEIDDRIMCGKVFNKVKNKDNIVLLKEDYGSRELKAIINQCYFIIGSRMHANIAALSQNIPTIAIAYSHKFYGIMQDFGLDSYVVDISEISESKIMRKVENLIKNRRNIVSRMKIRNREIKRKYSELEELLKNELGN
jgi:colanic acid/amylovoran biosynthesis protein